MTTLDHKGHWEEIVHTVGGTHLIKSREDVIRKLNLCYGRAARGRESDTEPGDALLAEGCVEHALATKLLLKPLTH